MFKLSKYEENKEKWKGRGTALISVEIVDRDLKTDWREGESINDEFVGLQEREMRQMLR